MLRRRLALHAIASYGAMLPMVIALVSVGYGPSVFPVAVFALAPILVPLIILALAVAPFLPFGTPWPMMALVAGVYLVALAIGSRVWKPQTTGARKPSGLDRQALKVILDREGIKPSSYELGGGLPSECYTIASEGESGWSVYYSERGVQSHKQVFSTEAEACANLLKLLREDRTTHVASSRSANA